MRRLNELLKDLNGIVADSIEYPKVKFFQQAELHTKDAQTYPISNNGDKKGTKISPRESYALQSYHRVLGSETETDYTKGKGKYPYQMRVYTIRNVWIGNLNRLRTKSYESNDDVKNDVVSSFPVILKDKEIVKINAENINKQEVLNEEFEGVDLKHLTLELIAFYIEYEIRQKVRC